MTDVTPALLAQVAGQQRNLAVLIAEMGHTLISVSARADMLERILTAGRADAPTPLDGAMHSIWLHGNWGWLTGNMTTEQREAAADAVQRYSDHLGASDEEPREPITDLRWWRDG